MASESASSEFLTSKYGAGVSFSFWYLYLSIWICVFVHVFLFQRHNRLLARKSIKFKVQGKGTTLYIFGSCIYKFVIFVIKFLQFHLCLCVYLYFCIYVFVSVARNSWRQSTWQERPCRHTLQASHLAKKTINNGASGALVHHCTIVHCWCILVQEEEEEAGQGVHYVRLTCSNLPCIAFLQRIAFLQFIALHFTSALHCFALFLPPALDPYCCIAPWFCISLSVAGWILCKKCMYVETRNALPGCICNMWDTLWCILCYI